MFARVRFDALKPVVGLVIPRDAVLGSLREARVFVVDTVSNTARERRIRCGAELRGYVTVIEGLTSGERVIVTGNTIVTDGTPIVVTTATVTQ
jgi:multidrug efflux pump subunit AcrA (membrane-fusion protein)